MDDIVDRVLARRIAKGVEEAKIVVGARVDGQIHARCVIVGVWSRLGPTDRTRVRRIANSELIVILRECLKARGFYLSPS